MDVKTEMGPGEGWNYTTTAESTVLYEPLDKSTLVALVAVGTALVLFILVLLSCGLLLLLKKLGCLRRLKLERHGTSQEMDEADKKRYSVISQTKAEIEMLKIEPTQTNGNDHNVDNQTQIWPERKEEAVPLMLESLPSSCSPYEVTILGTDASKRNSWGTRNTSFRLGMQDRDQLVQNLANRSNTNITKPDRQSLENNNTKDEQEGKRTKPEGIATVHQHHLPPRTGPPPPRPQLQLKMRPNNSIHYDIPRINPKPVSVVYVNKYSDKEETHIPGMVLTNSSDIPGLVKPVSPEVKPPRNQEVVATMKPATILESTEPMETPESVESVSAPQFVQPVSSAECPSETPTVHQKQAETPKVIPPWERYSNPSTPVHTPVANFPADKRSSLRQSSNGVATATDVMVRQEKQKPQVPPKRVSLEQFLRQKGSTPITDGQKRATIAGSTVSNPIYATPKVVTPRKVATVRPNSSQDKEALLERLAYQYNKRFSQDSQIQKLDLKDKTENNEDTDNMKDADKVQASTSSELAEIPANNQ